MKFTAAILFLSGILLSTQTHAEERRHEGLSLSKGATKGRMNLAEPDAKFQPLIDWLTLQTETEVSLDETKLKADFGITKEELGSPTSGFAAGTCSAEGCSFNIDLGSFKRTVRVIHHVAKAGATGDTKKEKFDEDGNRIISSEKELEDALKGEKKKKVALLFSSSLKKEDKLYYPVKADEKFFKAVNNVIKPFDPSKEPAGKLDGTIWVKNDKGTFVQLKDVVKGPVSEGGKVVVPAGTFATETTGHHCPPCRLLHSYLKQYKEAAPDTAVYVVDTGGFKTGPTEELKQLVSKYLDKDGWPNGVLFEKGASDPKTGDPKKDVAGYRITVEGNMKLPDHMINTIYPGKGHTWQQVAQAHVAKYQ